MNDMTQPKIERPTGLALLREPFKPNQISKLPKPTKAQTDKVKQDFKQGIRCEQCGAWHHKDVVHLDYVGHAALTDRLLDCDPEWNWEPVATDERGLPALDQTGGMWIKLTVCGVTRIGYGDADGKTGGNAVKERIGDALRNAAMRFGAALDLWHKGDLHGLEDEEPQPAPQEKRQEAQPVPNPEVVADKMIAAIKGADSEARLKSIWTSEKFAFDLDWLRKQNPERAAHVEAAKESRKESLKAEDSHAIDDEIPQFEDAQ